MPRTDDWFWSLPLSVAGWVVFGVLAVGVAAALVKAWWERRRQR